MSTYSLTLRQNIGRRLTIQEMDDNWLYVLENATGGSTGPQGPQGPGLSGSSGGTFSVEYSLTQSGYVLQLSRLGIFSNEFTGSFSVGDLIVASSSGDSGVISSIIFDMGIVIGIKSFTGTNYFNDDYWINQTQTGELYGQIYQYINSGYHLIYDINLGEVGSGNVSVDNGTASIITTYSVAVGNALIGDVYFPQQKFALVESVDPVVITQTFSMGILNELGLLAGQQVFYNYFEDVFSQETAYFGVAQTNSQPLFDGSILFLSNSGPNTTTSKLMTKIGHSEYHYDLNTSDCSSLEHSFQFGLCYTQYSGACCTSLGANACCVYYSLSANKFNFPIALPNTQKSTLRGCFSGSTVDIYFEDENNNNTYLGYQAAYNDTANNSNTFIGVQTGYTANNTCNNTYVGNLAGYLSTSDKNTFIGSLAGQCSTTGFCNVFIGVCSGFHNSSGTYNTFIGNDTGFNSCGTTQNTFIGFNSGYNNTSGGQNTYIGYMSAFNQNGQQNTFVGNCSGFCITCGDYNTFIGNEAGFISTGGNGNVAIGYCSGGSGSFCNSIAIGAGARPEYTGDFALGSSAFPILTSSSACVNGGGLDTLGVCYLSILLNGTRYKIPLFD